MSELLDTAACSDAQRREDLARNDAAMAHGVTRVSLAKVSGQHLSDAANEPSEAEKIAADLHYLQSQAQRDAAKQARAIEWQLIDFRARGLL